MCVCCFLKLLYQLEMCIINIKNKEEQQTKTQKIVYCKSVLRLILIILGCAATSGKGTN